MEHETSVLLLDDGELGNVHRMLLELGADVVRLEGAAIGRSVPAPRDLLISAGRRTLGDMPEVVPHADGANSPIWVCIHNQDFLPMRERLSAMGVNYLLQNALEEQARRSFLMQLLRMGAEQRRSHRLHLGGTVQYRTSNLERPGKLLDLSTEGCRVLTSEPYEEGSAFVALLPAALGGGEELELQGTVLRSTECESLGSQKTYSTVTRFEGLDETKREHLECIAEGKRIGTKITPLKALEDVPIQEAPVRDAKAEVEVEVEVEAEEQETPNRRGETRQPYDRNVHVLGVDAAPGGRVLGYDLSLSGVRLTGCGSVDVNANVTVALFGSPREEPTVVEATVVRNNDEGEVALAFDRLTPSNTQAIEKLLSSQVILDALNQPDAKKGRTVIAEIRGGETA